MTIGLVAAGALWAGGCSASHNAVVERQCCRDGSMPAAGVVTLLRAKCPTAKGRVTLDLAQSEVRLAFPCSTVRAPARISEAALAASVAHRHDAARRVDRVIALQKRVGVPALPRSEFVWMLGSLDAQTLNCAHAADVSYERKQIADAMGSGDAALHWVTVEAPLVGGYCPDRLAVFYRSVAAAGQPSAAEQVRAELPPQLSS